MISSEKFQSIKSFKSKLYQLSINQETNFQEIKSYYNSLLSRIKSFNDSFEI